MNIRQAIIILLLCVAAVEVNAAETVINVNFADMLKGFSNQYPTTAPTPMPTAAPTPYPTTATPTSAPTPAPTSCNSTCRLPLTCSTTAAGQSGLLFRSISTEAVPPAPFMTHLTTSSSSEDLQPLLRFSIKHMFFAELVNCSSPYYHKDCRPRVFSSVSSIVKKQDNQFSIYFGKSKQAMNFQFMTPNVMINDIPWPTRIGKSAGFCFEVSTDLLKGSSRDYIIYFNNDNTTSIPLFIFEQITSWRDYHLLPTGDFWLNDIHIISIVTGEEYIYSYSRDISNSTKLIPRIAFEDGNLLLCFSRSDYLSLLKSNDSHNIELKWNATAIQTQSKRKRSIEATVVECPSIPSDYKTLPGADALSYGFNPVFWSRSSVPIFNQKYMCYKNADGTYTPKDKTSGTINGYQRVIPTNYGSFSVYSVTRELSSTSTFSYYSDFVSTKSSSASTTLSGSFGYGPVSVSSTYSQSSESSSYRESINSDSSYLVEYSYYHQNYLATTKATNSPDFIFSDDLVNYMKQLSSTLTYTCNQSNFVSANSPCASNPYFIFFSKFGGLYPYSVVLGGSYKYFYSWSQSYVSSYQATSEDYEACVEATVDAAWGVSEASVSTSRCKTKSSTSNSEVDLTASSSQSYKSIVGGNSDTNIKTWSTSLTELPSPIFLTASSTDDTSLDTTEYDSLFNLMVDNSVLRQQAGLSTSVYNTIVNNLKTAWTHYQYYFSGDKCSPCAGFQSSAYVDATGTCRCTEAQPNSVLVSDYYKASSGAVSVAFETGTVASDYNCIIGGVQFSNGDIYEFETGNIIQWWTYYSGSTWYRQMDFRTHNTDDKDTARVLCFHKTISQRLSWLGDTGSLSGNSNILMMNVQAPSSTGAVPINYKKTSTFCFIGSVNGGAVHGGDLDEKTTQSIGIRWMTYPETDGSWNIDQTISWHSGDQPIGYVGVVCINKDIIDGNKWFTKRVTSISSPISTLGTGSTGYPFYYDAYTLPYSTTSLTTSLSTTTFYCWVGAMETQNVDWSENGASSTIVKAWLDEGSSGYWVIKTGIANHSDGKPVYYVGVVCMRRSGDFYSTSECQTSPSNKCTLPKSFKVYKY